MVYMLALIATIGFVLGTPMDQAYAARVGTTDAQSSENLLCYDDGSGSSFYLYRYAFGFGSSEPEKCFSAALCGHPVPLAQIQDLQPGQAPFCNPKLAAVP